MSVYLPLYVGDCLGECIERCMSEIMPGAYSYVDSTGMCYSYYLHCRKKCEKYCHDP